MAAFEGFIGGAYEAANPIQDSQRLINWYVEKDADPAAKTAASLLGVPGLVDLGQASLTGEVRGAWVLPGGTSTILAIGSAAVLMSMNVAPTVSTRATFTFTQIGTLSTTSGPVRIRDNGAGHLVAIVDGANLYTYNTKTSIFKRSTDPAWLGSNFVAEIDGWFIFAQPGTQKFYTSPVYWNGVDAFDGTYYALKDDAPDNIVAIIEQNRELWLIGEATTEVWYNAGGTYFPFSRLQGTLQQIGCAAGNSVSRYGSGLTWLSDSERGSGWVVMTQGYQAQRVSNPALSYAINQYPVTADAVGYTYTEEGHEFYCLTFPTADVTWVYDFTTMLWHQRASFDSITGLFHRQRANCVCNMQNMQIVGDFQNGKIYWQTRSVFKDDAYPLVCVRRAPHVWDRGSRNRVRHSRLQVEFKAGVGLSIGQGSDPQAMLRWSNDGSQTWGNEHWVSIGKIGETKNRAIWRRLGNARDRVYEVRFSDPVSRDIVGASLTAEPLGS